MLGLVENLLLDNREVLINNSQAIAIMQLRTITVQLGESLTYKILMLVRRQLMMNKCCLEKVLHGQASGDGIKRTPAYETPLTKSELEKWRKEFWGKFNI